MDPDQSASEEAGWLESTLFAIKHAVLHILVDMRVTCIHMLKLGSDCNFYLRFGENY